MFTSRSARMAGICASAAAMVFASAYPAAAEEVTAMANKSVSIAGGRMEFIDDGDVFKICDTLSEGEGVYGAVFYNSYYNNDGYQRVMTVNDGGDDGCDKKGYDIGNTGTYTFVICPGDYPMNAFQTWPGCKAS